MPASTKLPRSLHEFALLNAIPVTDYRFDADLDTVVQALEQKLPPVPPAAPDVAATDSLTTKVDQLQIQAIQLIEQGNVAAAQQALSEGWELLMEVRVRAPGPSFDVQFGYVCKTLAQAFEAAGDSKQADHYMGLAAIAFTRVERQGATGGISIDDLAGAVNGLGNTHSYRKESDEAIACYRRAVAILPQYAYAWHDLFLEYLTLANRGRFELGAMREAL
jgi:tetratricopeptide (TPR) repeat protein